MKNLDLLIPQPMRELDQWRWATVTATAPLRIRLDGETDPLDITPDNTFGPVAVGDRVWTQQTGRRILVTGKANGLTLPDAGSSEPVGAIKIYAGDVAPENYLMCWGQTFDANTYPELASVVGDKFGAHSGSLYYLPNMSGRTPVGYDAFQGEFNAVGRAGGAKTHTITTAEMPWHNHGGATHGMSTGGRTPGGSQTTTSTANPRVIPRGGGTTSDVSWTGLDHTHGINAEGGNAPHNNLQPYITMNFIICAR